MSQAFDPTKVYGPRRTIDQTIELPPAPTASGVPTWYLPTVRGIVRPEPINSPITGHIVVMGWGARETSGVNAMLIALRNGADVTGLEFASIGLQPNETNREWFGVDGIHLDIGYFPQLVTGAIAGAIYVKDWSPVGGMSPANSEWASSR